jgi:hypothetical protein
VCVRVHCEGIGFVFTLPDAASTCIKRDIRVYTISHFTYWHVCGEKKPGCVPAKCLLSLTLFLFLYLSVCVISQLPPPHIFLSRYLRTLVCNVHQHRKKRPYHLSRLLYIVLLPHTDNIIIITDCDGKMEFTCTAGKPALPRRLREMFIICDVYVRREI